MTTKIKNYTSTVSPEKSLAAIEALLVAYGAESVSKSYKNGEVAGVSFRLPIAGRAVAFRIPCRYEAIENSLGLSKLHTWRRDYKTRARAIREQARRTAWRLMHDWISVQLSMIKLEQAEPLEVFLPYAYDERTDTTLFEHMKADGFKALPAPAENPITEANWRAPE